MQTDPLDLASANALLNLHDRVRASKGSLVPTSPTLNLRQARDLRERGLIEIVNGGHGDMALFTKRGLDSLTAAAQIVAASSQRRA